MFTPTYPSGAEVVRKRHGFEMTTVILTFPAE
jgi:hypothetical protein